METPVTGPPNAQPPGEAGGEPSPLQPGAWVGRYQVEALLGRGGMGAVYRVRDSVLERSVALKAIRFGAAGDPAVYTRFRREAMALAQLNHRHVCQVHDWVEAEGGAFIAMELIEGQTLVEAGPAMDPGAKLRALRAIALALAAAHAKGIVHRDLKPSNIMVDAEGRVKVLDFGLARFLDPGEGPEPAADPGQAWHGLGFLEATAMLPPELDPETRLPGPGPEDASGTRNSLTLAGSFMGSPGYASPEQMCRLQVGPPSDIFSLGVLAWELLLGDHPFPGTGEARMAATVAGKCRSLAGRKLHPRMAGLLRGMLAQHPADRPSAERVVETLNRRLKPFPAAAWAALLAALVVLAVAVGYALLGRGIIADLVKDRPPQLVVLPIRNDTGEPALGPLAEVGMTELLAAALRDSPNLTVVDAERVNRAFTTFRLEPGRALEPEARGRLLQALGAPLVLQGALERDPGGALRFRYALGTRTGGDRYRGQVTLPAGGAFTAYALVDPAASELLRKVDPLGRSSGHGAAPPAEAFAAYARGKALFLKGDFKGSEPLLREAALKAPAYSLAVTAYASCLRRLGREQAILVSNWAVLAARATGDRWAEGRALGVKAYLARDRGDLAEAEQLRQTTLALAEALRDLDGAAVASNHLGLIAAERGLDEQAQGFYERSLELSRQVADLSYIALAQNNLGNLALKRGDLRGAAGRYQEVLATQRGMGNRFGEGLALNNLGVVALTSGNLAEAEGQLGKALAIREAAGDQAGRATSLRNLGTLALMKGELDLAQVRYGRALAASEEAGVRAIEAECRFCLADLLRLRQRLGPAQEEYRRALDLLGPGVTPQVRGWTLAGLAECEARLGKGGLEPARRQLEALPADQGGSPYALRAWAWVHFLGGRPEPALAALERARKDWITAPEIQRELVALRGQFGAGGP